MAFLGYACVCFGACAGVFSCLCVGVLSGDLCVLSISLFFV